MTKTCVICKKQPFPGDITRSFHKFPANSKLKQKWMKVIGIQEIKKVSTVCSDHFGDDSYHPTDRYTKTRRLLSTAVPVFKRNNSVLKTTTTNNIVIPSSIEETGHKTCSVYIDEYFLSNSLDSSRNNNTTLGTMCEDATPIEEVKKEMTSECRTCLQPLNSDEDLYYIYQNWVPPWEGIEDTIAEALQRIAHVQLSDMDPHSKVICGACCQKLHTACLFINLAQQSDYTLWQRNPVPSDSSIDNIWPRPIQIDKNIPFDEQKEIKKEELSDEEYGGLGEVEVGRSYEGAEIKIEPTELIPQEIPVEINGHYDGMSPEGLTPEISLNGDDTRDHLSVMVKEEPVSDNESVGPDMSLDCMLCAKVFNSVSGLKAHVIAHHSYKSVRRKAANETSPVKRQKHEYVCATCRRSFATSTDLMVHETCHNKSVCYGCNEKFDSFERVMQHRLTCNAVNNREQVPVKTLEDVQRPQRPSSTDSEDTSNPGLKCILCGESFTDNYYLNIHFEIHHPVPPSASAPEEDMEVEALESLFSERA